MIYSNSTIYSSLTHDRGSCDNGEVLLSAWKEMRIKFWVKKNWGGIHFPRVPGFWLIPMYDVPWSKHGVWTIGIQPWNRESSYWPLRLNGFHGSWCVTLIQFISNYVFMNIPWDPHIWQQQKKSTQCLMLVSPWHCRKTRRRLERGLLLQLWLLIISVPTSAGGTMGYRWRVPERGCGMMWLWVKIWMAQTTSVTSYSGCETWSNYIKLL
jgi:hypothetical protein